jgi:hypothetical protein
MYECFIKFNCYFLYEFISSLELNSFLDIVHLKQITALLLGLLFSNSCLAVSAFFIPSLLEV